MKLEPALLAALTGCALSLGLTSAQDESARAAFRERFTPEAEKRAQAIRASIEDELAAGGAPAWAGSYYYGDGLGTNVELVLAPKAGFHFEWRGCGGLYDRNFGTVKAIARRLHLRCVFPNRRRGYQGIAPEFLPVSWGERRYLIASSQILGFINDVNAGTEPRRTPHGGHLLRQGDERRPVQGKPPLPRAWSRALLEKPITGQVSSVAAIPAPESEKAPLWRSFDLVLDVGRGQGVWLGMRFYSTAKGSWTIGKVTAVTEGSCTVRARVFGPQRPAPQVSEPFSTRRF